MRRILEIVRALTRKERIVLVVAGVLCIAAGSGLLVLAVDRYTTLVPAQGGTLIEGAVGQPAYVNPILAETETDKGLVRLLFANIPELAEKIEADDTGKTWRLRLKEGLTWSDGKKITSDDVIFTIERIQEPDTGSPLFASWQGVAANRVSELEVQFNLVSPYPFFMDNLRELSPIPKNIFADTPSANWRLSDYNLKPIGSGPYRFVQYVKRSDGFIETYDMARNERYAGETPFLDTFTFRFFPRSEDVITAFNEGRVDAFGDFHPETVTAVARSYNVNVFAIPAYYAVFLNQNQNLALKEPEVRQALTQSVNRSELIRTVFDGRARSVEGPFFGAASGTPGASPDTAAASALLASAGWTAGENGLLEKKVKDSTLRLELTLTVPEIPFLVRTAELLSGAWQDIGVRANISAVSPQDLRERVLTNRDYQAVLFGNFLNPPHDLYPFWHSNERFYPGLNLSLYGNPAADTLLEQIRREPADEERARSIAELDAIITKDAPAVFLYAPDYAYLTNRNVQGIVDETLGEPSDRFAHVSRWYVKTTRALK